MSLVCDFLAVSESAGMAQVCAVLTAGDLAITVAVNLSTVCGTACCKFHYSIKGNNSELAHRTSKIIDTLFV